MVSLVVRGGDEAALRVMQRLRLVSAAPGLAADLVADLEQALAPEIE